MTELYCARWVLPVTSPLIEFGAIVIEGPRIAAVGTQQELSRRFPEARTRDFGEAAIIPGLVNTHSHLELTAMRGYLEHQESDFFAWLRKLTVARLERMTNDDLYVAAAWGACEAARAGVTSLGDASDAATQSMKALRDVGLRGIVYQESFGPDARLAAENFERLKTKVAALRELETPLVRAGVSPHAPYTVCARQLEMISTFAIAEKLPLMIHAAESASENLLLREGRGPFADNLAARGIEWTTPGCSTVQHLARHGVLDTDALLAHCINVDDADIETIRERGARVAHCPKSNAKLGHGRAPFAKFVAAGIPLGFGSDSVASNNTCDLLEEARFAILMARAAAGANGTKALPDADEALRIATLGGAKALGLFPETGALEAERQADFVVLSLAGAQQQPVYDPAAALIFASTARDVLLTVVAGREVYREGRITTIDEQRLSVRLAEIKEKLSA
jgi:cytosine/adenosine deaminase-related metal-dependent hydrolase